MQMKKKPNGEADFRNLDFDYEDIYLAPFVRYHYAKQAEEDAETLGGPENFSDEELAQAERQIERYIRREEWKKTFRRLYRVLQLTAVFLVLGILIFLAVTVRVDPVRQGVIRWLEGTGNSVNISLIHISGQNEQSGSLGSISWSLQGGTLSFSGTGELGAEIADQCRGYEGQVQTMVVSDGITAVGRILDSVGTLSLGKDVQTSSQRAAAAYAVSSDNPYLTAYDGCLYDKEETTLLAVPSGRDTLQYPDTLSGIGSLAYQDSCLSTLILPYGVTTLERDAFTGMRTGTVILLPDSLQSVPALADGMIYLFSEQNTAVAAVYTPPTDPDFLGENEIGELLLAWRRLSFRPIDDICRGISSDAVSGWTTISGVRCYICADGTLPTGWTQLDEGWTYFLPNHLPASGMTAVTLSDGVQSAVHTYYFDENGLRQTGLQYIDGKAYYFDENGIRLDSQWLEADGNWYYLGSGGAGVVSCWRLKDGKYRYLKSDGKMAADEWVEDYGNRYYVDRDGLKLTGQQTIGGKSYTFDEDGVLQEDASSSQNGFVTDGEVTRYYENGRIITGLQYIDGKAYIFDDQGIMQQSGWRSYGGNSYYLNDSGAAVVSCWRLGDDGRYRYLGSDGKMVYDSWVEDYGDRYFVDEEGARYESRWLTRDGSRYWFGGSGKMAAGCWLNLDGGRYYFYTDGKMASAARVQTDGSWYYVRENGRMASDCWILLEDDWYYFDSDGKMLTDTTTPDGYRVDLQGRRR
jgi:glucan-binding YG repeat protein